MTEIIDTHCHLDDEQFAADREAVLTRCLDLEINKIVIPAIHRDNWDQVLTLCQQHQALFPALGLHPLFVEKHSLSDIECLDEYLKNNTTVVAIGEIGLDFYAKDADREKQLYFLEKQLHLAEKYQLPVLLHVRKAHADILSCLKRYSLSGGIAHAFNGSLEQAYEYIKLGFKLGFGGVLTYERATKIRNIAHELPLSAIVLETDAPDMVGAAHKGGRNSPEYLVDTLSTLAGIRHQSTDEIARQTTTNAMSVFRGALQVIYEDE